MKKSVFYSLLMAFAMIFSCSLVASCGDDDPDPAPNPGGGGGSGTAKITSGTIYYIEGYIPSIFDWVNVQTSVSKTDGEKNYVTLNKDELVTLDNVPLPSTAKGYFNEICKGMKIPSDMLCHVTPVAIPSATPVSYTGYHIYSLKEGYTPTESKDFIAFRMFLFVGNEGSCFATSINYNKLKVRADKQADLMTRLTDNAYYRKTINLTVENGYIKQN